MGRISGGQRKLQGLVLPSTMDSKELIGVCQQAPSPTKQASISLVRFIKYVYERDMCCAACT